MPFHSDSAKVKYCQSLDFPERPDYSFLKRLFKEIRRFFVVAASVNFWRKQPACREILVASTGAFNPFSSPPGVHER